METHDRMVFMDFPGRGKNKLEFTELLGAKKEKNGIVYTTDAGVVKVYKSGKIEVIERNS